jgi:hypothetical protein
MSRQGTGVCGGAWCSVPPAPSFHISGVRLSPPTSIVRPTIVVGAVLKSPSGCGEDCEVAKATEGGRDRHSGWSLLVSMFLKVLLTLLEPTSLSVLSSICPSRLQTARTATQSTLP